MSSEEHWDLVDADGVPTGMTFRRGAPEWPPGQFHMIVAVCVRRGDGAVLLTQRAPGKEFPLGWEFPGGSALAGESSRAAAARELQEETGLAVPPDALTLVGRFAEASALLDLYVAEAPAQTDLRLQAAEVTAAEWVTVGEVERRVRAGVMATPWVARLDELWPSTLEAMSQPRSHAE
ncbi:MAG: NUDIX hydrolase [Actinobacteria bacterium]|nr:NUDIX hydrolase [Actinomycetota bacterium]